MQNIIEITLEWHFLINPQSSQFTVWREKKKLQYTTFLQVIVLQVCQDPWLFNHHFQSPFAKKRKYEMGH